ncbi:Mite allergen Der f 3 [Chionoecetes opilio]|uniref:Mite allergen Der f 3 n=1 Tax=Chionoecetes opilio TaxID=41210 RepID=A0A8J4YGX4_CHIOP|nr:Mite allergen Der f 3 [Chionoecetes opilio]
MENLRLVLSLLALAALGAASPFSRIVGGIHTKEGDYPEMVEVYSDPLIGGRSHLCGGVIMNDNHILTTATCVKGHNTGSLYVMAAGISLVDETDYQEHKSVNEVIVHPGFDPVTKGDDLAILRISHNFVFVSGLISPAILPMAGTPEPTTGTPLTAVGWGKDGVDGLIQEHQKAVNLTYLNREECSEVFGTFVQPNEGCLEGDEAEGVCMGDEGGVVEDKDGVTIAIVSWHISCDAFPGVVTLLAPYHEWITSHFDS